MEEWRDIKVYEGLYQVSNYGRVKSLERYEKCGNFIRVRKEKILKQKLNLYGYLEVGLCKNAITKYFKVHRLVAESFISNPNNYPQVNHKDENKENNCVDNLEWCDCSYNINYGTRSEKCAEKLLNREDISMPVYQFTLDGELIAVWKSESEAGRNGYNPKHISACCKGKEKKHKGFIWRYA